MDNSTADFLARLLATADLLVELPCRRRADENCGQNLTSTWHIDVER